jgi:hypothetical protein
MKVFEMTAVNPQGIKIVQRSINGVRYLKAQPANVMPLLLEQTKKSLSKFCKIYENNAGWIVIERTEDFLSNEQKEKMSSTLGIPVNSPPEDIIKKEAEMFKDQGFIVEVREYEC